MYNKQAHVKGDNALYPTVSAQVTNICVTITRLLIKAQFSPQNQAAHSDGYKSCSSHSEDLHTSKHKI